MGILIGAFVGVIAPKVIRKFKFYADGFDSIFTLTVALVSYSQEDSSMTLMQLHIQKGDNWENRLLKDVSLPTDFLAMVIRRRDETIIPKGHTKIKEGDILVIYN